MIELSTLPAINASLNATSATFLIIGFILIKRRAIGAHKIFMLLAFFTSTLFLASYLYYHYHHGHTVFPGQGWIRPVYLTILISHIVLAVTIVPLVLITLALGLRGKFQKHAKIARVTLPLWLYVSVTGVIVYWMLYQMNWG